MCQPLIVHHADFQGTSTSIAISARTLALVGMLQTALIISALSVAQLVAHVNSQPLLAPLASTLLDILSFISPSVLKLVLLNLLLLLEIPVRTVTRCARLAQGPLLIAPLAIHT